jgi:hypothetical protein
MCEYAPRRSQKWWWRALGKGVAEAPLTIPATEVYSAQSCVAWLGDFSSMNFVLSINRLSRPTIDEITNQQL